MAGTHLSVDKVVSPEGSDLVLPTNVPHCEADVLVLHRLHIETYTTGGTGLCSRLTIVGSYW